jgi:hypothetical protein
MSEFFLLITFRKSLNIRLINPWLLLVNVFSDTRTDYTIYVKITDDARSGSILYIEVEQLDTNDRWQGEFTSRCKLIYGCHIMMISLPL